MAVFSFLLIGPTLFTEAESGLPSCCRREAAATSLDSRLGKRIPLHGSNERVTFWLNHCAHGHGASREDGRLHALAVHVGVRLMSITSSTLPEIPIASTAPYKYIVDRCDSWPWR